MSDAAGPSTGRRLLVVLLLGSLALNAYLLWWPDDPGPVPGSPQAGGTVAPLVQGLTKQMAAETQPALSGQELQWLFEQGDYEAALTGLALLPAATAFELRAAWLAECMRWVVEEEELERARRFVRAGLQLSAADIDFRQLQAEIYLAEGRTIEAVDLLYALMRESDAALQGVFVSRLQTLFKSEVDRLVELKAWQPLVAFAERLLWHEPGHPPYSLVHARALLMLERYGEARAGLLAVTADPYYGAKAQELLDEIDRKRISGGEVKLRTLGAHHLVAATLNGNTGVDLMIDTGASYSVVDSRYFSALQARGGLRPEPVFVRNAKINTAGGVINAQVYRFASLALDDFVVRNIEIVVTPLDSVAGSHGLLGMNFLQHFDFVIDQQYQLLSLVPRK